MRQPEPHSHFLQPFGSVRYREHESLPNEELLRPILCRLHLARISVQSVKLDNKLLPGYGCVKTDAKGGAVSEVPPPLGCGRPAVTPSRK